MGAWEDLGACSEVRAVPAWLEALQTWCHLWLWCHLQIQSLSWGEELESHGRVHHVEKGAPLALSSPQNFGLPEM